MYFSTGNMERMFSKVDCNAVIYLAEGNYKDAALSAVGIIPFRDIAKGLKWVDEEVAEGVVKYADETEELVEEDVRETDEIVTHGNKLDNKPAEGYPLRDRATGEVRKFGETTRGLKHGAGKQKRYSKKYLKKNNLYYQKEIEGTKKEMHSWQHQEILKHKAANGGPDPI